MRVTKALIIIGTCMFVTGLAVFYSVKAGEVDPFLRFAKNLAVFVGLCGLGVVLGGALQQIANRDN